MRKEIEKLLKSDLSGYRISKATGVPQGNISQLRRGTREIGKLSLDTAEKLYEFYKKNIESNK